MVIVVVVVLETNNNLVIIELDLILPDFVKEVSAPLQVCVCRQKSENTSQVTGSFN